MNPLKWIPSWVYWIAIAVLVTAVGAQQLRIASIRTDLAETKTDHAEQLRKQATAHAAEQLAARTREQMLNQHAAVFNQEKVDEINRSEAALRVANERLRNRPERPAATIGGVPKTASACESGTGAGLYREDGRFLNGEAARANRLRAALAECYKRYDDATQVN